MPGEQSPVKVLEKAFDIIEIISRESGGLSLSEIARVSGFNKSTAYRILQTMVERRYVVRDDKGSYRIGDKLMEINSAYISRLELHTESRPYLWQLSNRLHLSAILAVFTDHTSILVDKMEYVHDYSNYKEIGSRPPVYCTAHGKLMLSCLSSGELEQAIGSMRFVSYTINTHCSREALLADLKQIRQRGYAVDNEEHEYNQRCIATPIFDYRGEAIAALTVSGTCMQINKDNIASIAGEIIKAAGKISKRMGYFSEEA